MLHTLATEFAVFNGWFSSIPGPTICNRAFAHYGTSFGNVDMNMFLMPAANKNNIPSIYERLASNGHTGRLYYFDQASSTMEIANLLTDQSLFGTFDQFLHDCRAGTLPDYSFVEPNYSDHPGPGGGELLANDQHPDHHVLAGDRFIATVYNQIRIIPQLWESTALLVVYDEHGGLYDHVQPPSCTPDGFAASAAATGTGSRVQVRPARRSRAGDLDLSLHCQGHSCRGHGGLRERTHFRARLDSSNRLAALLEWQGRGHAT